MNTKLTKIQHAVLRAINAGPIHVNERYEPAKRLVVH